MAYIFVNAFKIIKLLYFSKRLTALYSSMFSTKSKKHSSITTYVPNSLHLAIIFSIIPLFVICPVGLLGLHKKTNSVSEFI